MSCRLTILGSGSSGNCAYLESDTTRLLVDAGLSARQIVDRLASIGKTPADLQAILVTHEHADHVQGLSVLARKFHVPIYANRLTREAILENWRAAYGKDEGRKLVRPSFLPAVALAKEVSEGGMKSLPPSELGDENEKDAAPKTRGARRVGSDKSAKEEALKWRIFESGQCFPTGDFDIEPFSIPHDASDPMGFLIHHAGRSIAFLTDLGHMNHLTLEKARKSHILLLETNHDTKLLQDDPRRPWAVKQRIAGRHGHLSNESAATALAAIMSDRLEHVYLAHLSQDCNRPELAEGTIRKKLGEMGASHVRLTVTHPNQPCATERLEAAHKLEAETPSLFARPAVE